MCSHHSKWAYTNPSSMSKFEIQAFPLFKNFLTVQGLSSIKNQAQKMTFFSQNKQVSSGPPIPRKLDEIDEIVGTRTAPIPNMMHLSKI